MCNYPNVTYHTPANITDGGAGNVNDAMRIKYVDAPQVPFCIGITIHCYTTLTIVVGTSHAA